MEDNQSERSFEYEDYRKKFAYLVVCKDCVRSYDSKNIPETCRHCNSANILVKDKTGGVVNDKTPKSNVNDTAFVKTKMPMKAQKTKASVPKNTVHSNFTVLGTVKANGKTYEIRKTDKRVYTYDVKGNTRKGGVWIKPRIKDSLSIEEITEKQYRK